MFNHLDAMDLGWSLSSRPPKAITSALPYPFGSIAIKSNLSFLGNGADVLDGSHVLAKFDLLSSGQSASVHPISEAVLSDNVVSPSSGASHNANFFANGSVEHCLWSRSFVAPPSTPFSSQVISLAASLSGLWIGAFLCSHSNPNLLTEPIFKSRFVGPLF